MALVKRYKINNNSCEECIDHLLDEVSSLEGILDVKVSIDKNEIVVKSSKKIDEAKINDIISNLNNYHKAHESNLIEEEFLFDEIDCPNCAAKIEDRLNKEEKIVKATISFLNKKVIIVHSKDD